MSNNQKDQNAIDQMLGQSPSWMLRWGIILVLIVFVLACILACLIQYPDTIRAKAQLHTEILPVRLNMPVSGQVDSVFIQNGDSVQKGTLLASLQSTANFEEVLLVENFCQNWNITSKKKLPSNSATLKLDEILPLWSDFLIHQKAYDYFVQNDISALKKNNIEHQIAKLEELNAALLQQQTTLQASVDLARLAKERGETLLAQKSASRQEVEQSTSAFLVAQQSLERHNNSIINNELQIEKLKASLLEVAFEQKRGSAEKKLQLQKDIQEILAAIELWKKNYLLFAPMNGQINKTDNWILGQFIPSQTPLFSIAPVENNPPRIFATALVPSLRLGKINQQTLVQIQLDAYPYQEFGILEGKVKNIPTIAENEVYKILVELPYPLQTSYNKTIEFRHEMTGTALFITQKRSLAERLFDRILSVIKN